MMPNTGTQTTKLNKAQRIAQVQNWLIEGKKDFEIIKLCKEEWGIGTRMCRNYLRWGYELFKPQADLDIQSKRDKRISDLIDVITKMDDKYKKTPAGVNAIQRVYKQIIRLEGTEMPKQFEITNTDVLPIITKRQK